LASEKVEKGLDGANHGASIASARRWVGRRAGEPATGTDTVPLVHFSFNGRSKCESGKKSEESKENGDETHFVERLCMWWRQVQQKRVK